MTMTEQQIQEFAARIQNPLLAAMLDALNQAQARLSDLLCLDTMPVRLMTALKSADKIVGDGISFALTDMSQPDTAVRRDPAHTVARIRGFNRIACATLDSMCSCTVALPYVEELQKIVKLLSGPLAHQQAKTG